MNKLLERTSITLDEAEYLVRLMNDYDSEAMLGEEIEKLAYVDNPYVLWSDALKSSSANGDIWHKNNKVDGSIVLEYMEGYRDIEYWEFSHISTEQFEVGRVIKGRMPSGLVYEIENDYTYMDNIDFEGICCYKFCSMGGHLVVFFGKTDESIETLKTIQPYGDE